MLDDETTNGTDTGSEPEGGSVVPGRIIDSSVQASSEYTVKRAYRGEDLVSYPEGSVNVSVSVTVECFCGSSVQIHSMQSRGTCQTCGFRWNME